MDMDAIQKCIYNIIATCASITKLNPRSVNVDKNPITKKVRSFGNAFDDMEDEEIVDMSKSFYQCFYLDAIEEESPKVKSWLEGDVFLRYGEADVQISLRISDCYRIAKDIDEDKKIAHPTKKWTQQLKYEVIELMKEVAPKKAIKEKLEERMKALAKSAGKASIGAAITGMEGLNQMLEGFGGTGGFTDAAQKMLSNPSTRKMFDSMMGVLPSEIQGPMSKLANDVADGRPLAETIGELAQTGKDMFNNLVNNNDEVEQHVDLSLDENVGSSSKSHPLIECDDDVCYPVHDHHLLD